MRLGFYGPGLDSDLSVRSCAAPSPARTREAPRGAHTARPPAPSPRAREGARFTYGVYLQESLEVPDAMDLTVRQPLNYLAGDLGFLQADTRSAPAAAAPAPPAAPPAEGAWSPA